LILLGNNVSCQEIQPDTMATPKKTTLPVTPQDHRRLKNHAKSCGKTMKELTSLLMEYVLDQLQSGALKISPPSLQGTGSKKKGAA